MNTNTATELRRAYSIAGAEQQLEVSHATIYELIKEKKLKTYKVGRRRYVSGEALNDFIRAREAEMEDV